MMGLSQIPSFLATFMQGQIAVGTFEHMAVGQKYPKRLALHGSKHSSLRSNSRPFWTHLKGPVHLSIRHFGADLSGSWYG